MQKLDIKATSLAAALLWGLTVLLVGVVNHLHGVYGHEFLTMLSSIYPGYRASGTIGDLVTGIVYALVDGALLGLVFGWLYNRFMQRTSQETTTPSITSAEKTAYMKH